VNEQVKIDISVEEIPQGNMVVSRQGGAKGRFTFTSAESGDHSICLSPAPTSWFDSTRTVCILFKRVGMVRKSGRKELTGYTSPVENHV
jgi:hypothetical protein